VAAAAVQSINRSVALELPSTGCSSLEVDSVLPRGSAELGSLQPLLIIMRFRR